MAKVTVGDVTIEPGQRRRIDLPVARLPTQSSLSLPVEVVNGVRDGPRLWISAALHGDELNGVEIVDRVLEKIKTRNLAGEIVAVPVVNVFGFINRTRYLPDGRDLNRSFPGSARGSLASRLANLFMREIVGHCTHGIDLHTAGGHRTNLPQVRADLDDPETRRLAEAFTAPLMIHGEAPRGSLRYAVARRGVPIIVYEAGEPHRFNRSAVDHGVKGILRVLSALGMTRQRPTPQRAASIESRKRAWIRARRSGILRLKIRLGQSITKGQLLGTICDAFGDDKVSVVAPSAGLVIGHTHHPLVNEGDAVIHLAQECVPGPGSA